MTFDASPVVLALLGPEIGKIKSKFGWPWRIRSGTKVTILFYFSSSLTQKTLETKKYLLLVILDKISIYDVMTWCHEMPWRQGLAWNRFRIFVTMSGPIWKNNEIQTMLVNAAMVLMSFHAMTSHFDVMSWRHFMTYQHKNTSDVATTATCKLLLKKLKNKSWKLTKWQQNQNPKNQNLPRLVLSTLKVKELNLMDQTS